MKEMPNEFPAQNKNEQTPEDEVFEKEAALENETLDTKEVEEPKTENEQGEYQAEVELADQAAVESAMLKIENIGNENTESLEGEQETPPELQEYIDNVTGIMEKELEGMNFDPDAEVVEKPKKTKLKKAMLIVTAGVTLWLSSATTFTGTAEAKSNKNNFNIGSIFEDALKKTTDELKKMPEDIAREATKEATKEMSGATKKAINDVLNGIFK